MGIWIYTKIIDLGFSLNLWKLIGSLARFEQRFLANQPEHDQ
jgi:hypothetical protein